ncbi:MAG: FtsX-like permease family protein [Chloroflexi bacterium]|nr:FtsX-like permease family protein [Chloroflexota bacterium]
MDELFGAPMGAVVGVLASIFAVISLYLIYIALRHPILVRMALRNVLRRPARSMLIVIGLMLATAIISSSFTTGDSITFSIKQSAIESLRGVDELIRVDEDSDVWEGQALPDQFSESIFEEIVHLLDADPDLDGVLPVLAEDTAVINLRTRQFEVEALYTGLDPARAAEFEPVKDLDGRLVDLATLASNEVYIDSEGAERIGAEAGDVLGVPLGPGELAHVTVKAVVDGWYSKGTDTKLVLMAPLTRVQEQLGQEGRLTFVLLSNRGDELGGLSLTSDILERYGELPALTNAGLEVFDLKQDVVDLANQVGSLFVSFFTTFGLFSIGAGLLLIFLIFSMLAAERRREMGMARAVGMLRRHLVRQFVAEGAIYGLGSAVVGAAVGIGLGYLLILASGEIFSDDPTEDFSISAHVELRSVLASFLIGSIVTYLTVIFASRRTSRLNIVRAIRDIAEPQSAAGIKTLIWGVVALLFGVFVGILGYQSAQATLFGLGVSLVPVGIALILRWRGVAQRWVLTGTGLFLLVYWLLPPSVYNNIRDDWSQDFSIFFLSGALVVTGAVLVTVNNAPTILGLLTNTLGRIRPLTPIVKSAVAYPLRFGFRTGLSVAMFAVVIFSVVVMLTLIEGFNKLFEDQERLGGGYDVIAFAQSDLNPVADLSAAVDANPDLAFVSSENGMRSVGTFRTFFEAEARLSEETDEAYRDTSITGVDDDFVESNKFQIKLATAEYVSDSGFDGERVWRDLSEQPGLAVANAFLVPTRNNFNFAIQSDSFGLDGVEDLFLENDTMDPVLITVQDLKSGAVFDLKVIAVLDDFASQGPLPFGIFTSTNTLKAEIPRDVGATQMFFNVEPGTVDPADKIEAAFFEHALETLDVSKTIEDIQASQRSFFNLLIGFMTLGLIVGIAALGVISARAVVERRHQIGVMRAIGFSRRMVQLSFLAESSFIAIVGIGWGVALGLGVSVNIIADTRTDEPNIQFVVPWAKLAVIVLGAYAFSLLTTYLPSRQAGRTAPAEALRYE